MVRTTLSVIKADVGSLAGHHVAPPQLLDVARQELAKAKKEGLIEDFYVTRVGDDLELIMTHRKGEESEEIHTLAWETFKKAADTARELGLYGAGQDLL